MVALREKTGISASWVVLGALCLAVSVFMTWLLSGRPCHGIDDACIFFDYARNLAAGKGITYGNLPTPVEGCTSFLWMLVCAGCFALGVDFAGVFICTCACLVGAQCLWIGVLRRLVGQEHSAELGFLLYVLLVVGAPSYICWMSITMMDTALWGLFVGAFGLFLVADRRLAGRMLPFFILSPLVRPETLMLVPCCLGLRLVGRWKERGEILLGLRMLAGFGLSALALEAFRLWYFGYPLPNTFYAKVSPSLLYNLKFGFVYFNEFFLSALPLLGGAFLLAVMRWPWRGAHLSLLGWLPISLLPPILTGGDHFDGFRFYQPFYPLLCVLFVAALMQVRERLPMPGVCLVLGVLAFCPLAPNWVAFRYERCVRGEFEVAARGYADGAALSLLFREGGAFPRLGVIAAGGIALSYEGPVVDLVGLNNVEVAHNHGERKGKKNHAAFEPDQFHSLAIDVVVAELNPFFEYIFKGMLTTPLFAEAYRYGRLEKPTASLSAGPFFVRKAFVDKLPSSVRFVDEALWSGKGWSACP